jgi:hypothetical protein
MPHTLPEITSTMALLRGWRLLAGADRHRAKELRVEAQRSFRLARSTVGLGLAAELEAIGLQFEKEADDLSAKMQAVAYQICYSGFGVQSQTTYCLPKLWQLS